MDENITLASGETATFVQKNMIVLKGNGHLKVSDLIEVLKEFKKKNGDLFFTSTKHGRGVYECLRFLSVSSK